MTSFVRHGENDNGKLLHLGTFDALASYAPKQPAKPLGAGIVLKEEEGSYLILATNVTFIFRVLAGENKKVVILRYEERNLSEGTLKRGRVLNGDEMMTVAFSDMPALRKIRLYKY